jgi:hypothetical protein
MMNEEFKPFEDRCSAMAHYSQRVNESFDFLRQKQTGFHEVDIKRWEARQCVVFELGISAIVMISVTLEECLKTLLKRHYFYNNLEETPGLDLEQWEKTSLEAEDAFGTFRLHNAIQKARKENLITETEEQQLLGIKDHIRNAFVHSDKSKMFDEQAKTRVDVIKFEDGTIKHKGSREMNILALNIGQGIAEKELANRESPRILEQIDSILVTICERFWQTHSRPNTKE